MAPRPVLGAFLPPDIATWMLAQVLDATLPAYLERWERAGADPGHLVRVRERALAVRQAGAVGAEWARMSAAGRADVVEADTPPDSGEIDVAAAAELLGLSTRQVRRLAGDGVLAARRVGATWLIERAAVEICRQARMEARAA
jgi:excisionase family DNA binding protein